MSDDGIVIKDETRKYVELTKVRKRSEIPNKRKRMI